MRRLRVHHGVSGVLLRILLIILWRVLLGVLLRVLLAVLLHLLLWLHLPGRLGRNTAVETRRYRHHLDAGAVPWLLLLLGRPQTVLLADAHGEEQDKQDEDWPGVQDGLDDGQVQRGHGVLGGQHPRGVVGNVPDAADEVEYRCDQEEDGRLFGTQVSVVRSRGEQSERGETYVSQQIAILALVYDKGREGNKRDGPDPV